MRISKYFVAKTEDFFENYSIVRLHGQDGRELSGANILQTRGQFLEEGSIFVWKVLVMLIIVDLLTLLLLYRSELNVEFL